MHAGQIIKLLTDDVIPHDRGGSIQREEHSIEHWQERASAAKPGSQTIRGVRCGLKRTFGGSWRGDRQRSRHEQLRLSRLVQQYVGRSSCAMASELFGSLVSSTEWSSEIKHIGQLRPNQE